MKAGAGLAVMSLVPVTSQGMSQQGAGISSTRRQRCPRPAWTIIKWTHRPDAALDEGRSTRDHKRVGPSPLQECLEKGTVPSLGLGAGFAACQLPRPLSFLPAVSHAFFPHCQLPSFLFPSFPPFSAPLHSSPFSCRS